MKILKNAKWLEHLIRSPTIACSRWVVFWKGNRLCNFRGFICHYLRPHFLEGWLTCSMLNALPSPNTLAFHLPIQLITNSSHPIFINPNFPAKEKRVTQPLLTLCRRSHTSRSYVPKPRHFAPVRGPVMVDPWVAGQMVKRPVPKGNSLSPRKKDEERGAR